MPSYKAAEPVSRPDYVESGEYTVEVLNADESVSKQGNELIELKLKIEPSGAILYDNLVFAPNAFWKIDAFRLATGEEVQTRIDRHRKLKALIKELSEVHWALLKAKDPR